MGMTTIDDAIHELKRQSRYYKDFWGAGADDYVIKMDEIAIDTMRKYQKIEQIANDKNINGDLLRMSEIRWVLEDGSENNHHASNT